MIFKEITLQNRYFSFFCIFFGIWPDSDLKNPDYALKYDIEKVLFPFLRGNGRFFRVCLKESDRSFHMD